MAKQYSYVATVKRGDKTKKEGPFYRYAEKPSEVEDYAKLKYGSDLVSVKVKRVTDLM